MTSSRNPQERSEIVTYSVIHKEEDGQISKNPQDDIMGITIHLICGPGNKRNLNVSQFEREATQKCYHRSRILLRFCNSLVYFFLHLQSGLESGLLVVEQCSNYYTVGLLLTPATSSSSTGFTIPFSTQFSVGISVETGADLLILSTNRCPSKRKRCASSWIMKNVLYSVSIIRTI